MGKKPEARAETCLSKTQDRTGPIAGLSPFYLLYIGVCLQKKLTELRTDPVRMAVFASGGGSNARNIWQATQQSSWGTVALFLTNNPQSGVVTFGAEKQVPVQLARRETYQSGPALLEIMAAHDIELIILAGYLKLIPSALIAQYPGRILNIHPSLLPAYGGRGMYGINVHQAVIAAGESLSGMTIHFVNEQYDQGEIIFQAQIPVAPTWSATDLRDAVLQLEHLHYPRIIEKVCYSLHNQ